MTKYRNFLFAIGLYGILISCGCRDKGSGINGQMHWHMDDPSEYYRVDDPQQNAVLYWLQSEPTTRNVGPVLPSPYSHEEWEKRGRNIPNIENHLIDLYQNYTGDIWVSSIVSAFEYVGTFRSVPFLITIMEDSELEVSDRILAIGALSVIGDPVAVPPLIKILRENRDTSDPSNQNELKTYVFRMLAMIGDPRAISSMEEWLRNTQFPTRENALYEEMIRLLKQNEPNFIQDWILRWPLGNAEKNSKGLPYFRSEKKWAMAVKDIPGVNQILFDLYRQGDKKVSNDSILFAIGAIGSKQDIQPLLDLILNDPGMGPEEIDTAFRSIYNLGGIQILDEIIARVEGTHFINDQSEGSIKCSIIAVFSGKGKDDKLASIEKRCYELNPMGKRGSLKR